MSENKVSSGGTFGGGKKAAKPATPAKPAPARGLDKSKQQAADQRRAQARARQEEWAREQKVEAALSDEGAQADALTQRLATCQREFNGLQDDILLTSVHDDMGRVEGVLTTLASDLARLRGAGYAFQGFLENKVSVLADKWEALREEIEADIEKQGDALTKEAEAVARSLRSAGGKNESLLARAERAVEALQSKSEAARTALQGRYRDVAQTIHQTRSQLDEIDWAMEQLAEAKFPLLQAEYLVAACKAKHLDDPDDKEGSEGILFLSDERLIFEQKQKVATKKFLFITTESEMVQETLFAEPLGHLEKVGAQDKRHFLATKELLELHFSPDARQRRVLLQLEGGAKNEEWCQRINRVQSGEIEGERVASAASAKESVTTKAATAPTVCPTCGATFPAAIARGQSSLSCDYCGAVVRL